jgi:hypothetical protein
MTQTSRIVPKDIGSLMKENQKAITQLQYDQLMNVDEAVKLALEIFPSYQQDPEAHQLSLEAVVHVYQLVKSDLKERHPRLFKRYDEQLKEILAEVKV